MGTRKKKWNEYEAILHSLKDDILVTNTEGIILKVSEATGSIYDVNSEDLIGKSVYDLEKEGLFTPLATPIVIKNRKKTTFIQTTQTGKKLLVTGIPVFDPNNDLVRIVSYSHDVTELLEMEKYLIEMKDEMQRVKSELELMRSRSYLVDGVIANSAKMRNVIDTALQIAEVDVNVLLLGESGVGKSLIAKFIHQKSPRRSGPFIEVNCGAIPESLFEAEFFGYETGSFTGANKKGKLGFAELAEGGTLFLDEIGELSFANQVKVLKFIQEKQFYRVGGTAIKKVDFRLIAATNRNLEEMVRKKTFRQDLFFRLNVVPITIPPLRERTEDIIPLIDRLLTQFSKKYHRKRELHEDVLKRLLSIEWKGNVRELINLIERLVVTSSSPVITLKDLPDAYASPIPAISLPGESDDHPRTMKEMLEEYEREILARAKTVCKTQTEMAKVLGISQPSIVRKLQKYGL
ncbi:sigma 54-interacting transcriptional regulator [Brevibacillus humidisoli]|uniref:sigma-54 interaction domain-containing protein n=1 Tax=Brevibacillus humidisoli TaxID=2895522 RepID=UPI001E652590|nr:sigma 54-interacting transcriptional regulator [Brevibacillus humidisoli]UFJ39641.1 sigma 54-interacting transcriptional regulator [Brevibacillus humidisoli]